MNYREKLLELRYENVHDYALEKWLNKISLYDMRIIFGGGGLGRLWISLLNDRGISVDFFCDNNRALECTKIGGGVKYISPEDLPKIKGNVIIIIAVTYYQNIHEQLLEMGFDKEQLEIMSVDTFTYRANEMMMRGGLNFFDVHRDICDIADACEDELSVKILYQTLRKYAINPHEAIDYTGEAYFIPEIPRSKQEVFVDAGAFNGDTLEAFLNVYGNCFEKYYAFELDAFNYRDLCNKIEGADSLIKEKITAYNIGLWDEKKEVQYDRGKSATSVDASGACTGVVDKLDNILRERISFMKMDIEGAEINAMMGAMELLQAYKPVCAICIYHSLKDFIQIPKILRNLGYKIMIRHHDWSAAEIVCYAYI